MKLRLLKLMLKLSLFFLSSLTITILTLVIVGDYVASHVAPPKQVKIVHKLQPEVRNRDNILVAMTMVTTPGRNFPQLLESARRNNISLVFLGAKKKFVGSNIKIEVFRDFVRTLPHDTVCLGLDAYDTLLLAEPWEIVQKFHASREQVVFSINGPKDSWPQIVGNAIKIQVPLPGTRDQYLNSGAHIGYASSLLAVYNKVLARHGHLGFDQFILARLKVDKPEIFGTDMRSEIFLTLFPYGTTGAVDLAANGYEIDARRQKIVHAASGVQPCVFHAPANADYSSVLEGLGYRISPQQHSVVANLRHSMKITSMHVLGLALDGRYLLVVFLILLILTPLVLLFTACLLLQNLIYRYKGYIAKWQHYA